MLDQQEERVIKEKLGRDLTKTERALFEAMWSEHISYKSSKRWFNLFYTNDENVYLGIGEGAGLVKLTDEWLVGLALESHNHPSAVDPYNGAATGVGGIIRDIISQGCHPIALLDSLHFGELESMRNRYLLEEVVRGISNYGNSVGVPNVGGEVEIHSSFGENPLVNVMCVGLVKKDEVIRSMATHVNQQLILFGSTTGRDGIHGVTFASRELSDEADEERGSIQVGDPLAEKILIDIIAELREKRLLAGLQDLGGGGLTCAASEMVSKNNLGARIFAEKVPLREENMEPWEIMISESQERMLAVVEPENVEQVLEILEKYEVPHAVVGEVIKEDIFEVQYKGEVKARVPASFLVNGIPQPHREIGQPKPTGQEEAKELTENKVLATLEKVLANWTIADKTWIYEQYDQHVQIRTVFGPGEEAGVLFIGDNTFIALTLNSNSRWSKVDPYHGSAAVTRSAIRGVLAVGADPLALVDNLNFGNPENPESYWEFVEAIKGIAQVTQDAKIPVVGGNVSLYNEYVDENGKQRRINPAPVIGVLGKLTQLPRSQQINKDDLQKGIRILLVGWEGTSLRGSITEEVLSWSDTQSFPRYNKEREAHLEAAIKEIHELKGVKAIGDVSKGGVVTKIAQVCIKSECGAELHDFPELEGVQRMRFWFGEGQPAFLIWAEEQTKEEISNICKKFDVPLKEVGEVQRHPRITLGKEEIDLQRLKKSWKERIPIQMG